jgi:hypothetical protein
MQRQPEFRSCYKMTGRRAKIGFGSYPSFKTGIK